MEFMSRTPFTKMSGLTTQVGIALPWLVGLRWVAMVSQALLILVLVTFFNIPVPPVLVIIIFGFSWLSNMLLHQRQQSQSSVTNGHVTSILLLDTVLLTLLLFATGGAMNPFTFLYMVILVLGAVILPQVWSWVITGATILCYGALFLPGIETIGALTSHPPACHVQNEVTGSMRLHLQGMWLAYAVSAFSVVFIVGKIQKALSLHRGTIRSLEKERVRSDMLASLATLAAGAAHELSTPLSTIAVASGEMIDVLQEQNSSDELLGDAVLIRNQVRNCKDILFQMAADAGEHRGEENRKFKVAEAVEEIISSVSSGKQHLVQVDNAVEEVILCAPYRTLCRTIAGLVNNALEASTESAPVKMSWFTQDEYMVVSVTDTGCGMDDETVSQATEPFFTTRNEGMGLGLFLADTMAERFNGSLDFQTEPGKGTIATLRMEIIRIVANG